MLVSNFTYDHGALGSLSDIAMMSNSISTKEKSGRFRWFLSWAFSRIAGVGMLFVAVVNRELTPDNEAWSPGRPYFLSDLFPPF